MPPPWNPGRVGHTEEIFLQEREDDDDDGDYDDHDYNILVTCPRIFSPIFPWDREIKHSDVL